MFEDMSDVDLIEVMGEATRDESTAIAQRLAAVAQLFVRRSAGRAMRFRPHRALAACADDMPFLGGKLYCRTHHLIKTFYAGFGGWADKIPR